MKTNINWDALRHSLGGLLVAGGPIATLLAAQGVDAGTINTELGYLSMAVGVICTIAPLVLNVLGQTDAGKAATINHLDPTGQDAVLSKVDPAILASAVVAHPEVKGLIIRDNANGPLGTLAADPGTPKIVSETQAKVDP